MATIPFDTLDFTRQLKAGGFSAEQAETMADALKSSAMAELATKRDIGELRTDFDSKLRDLENRVVIKLGAMMAAGAALLFAALKLTT